MPSSANSPLRHQPPRKQPKRRVKRQKRGSCGKKTPFFLKKAALFGKPFAQTEQGQKQILNQKYMKKKRGLCSFATFRTLAYFSKKAPLRHMFFLFQNCKFFVNMAFFA